MEIVLHDIVEQLAAPAGLLSGLVVGAGQQVAVSQYAEQPPSPQTELKHVLAAVEISKTWRQRFCTLELCIASDDHNTAKCSF